MNSNSAQTSETKFNADAYLEMVGHGLAGTEASARDRIFQQDSQVLNMAKLSGLIDGMSIRAIVQHVEPQDPHTRHQFQSALNNQRFPAVAAVYSVRFTDSLGLGPFTIAPGGAGVSRGPGLPVYRSINTANVIIPNGGFVDVLVRAPTPGTAGLVPDGSLTYFASGAFPGVTVTNPGPGAAVAGVDEEGVAAFVLRCQSCKELIAKNYEAIKNGERQY